MPNADIVLDTNSIELRDGNVTVTDNATIAGSATVAGNVVVNKASNSRSITIGGSGAGSLHVKNSSGVSLFEISANLSKFIARNSSNVPRMEIDAAAGKIILRHTNGVAAVELSSSGLVIRNTGGAISSFWQASGTAIIYQDMLIASPADIKLDNQDLSTRLDNIEQRLTNGGL